MIEDILKKRTNCSFFREDKIPDKKIIDDILNKAHTFINNSKIINDTVKMDFELNTLKSIFHHKVFTGSDFLCGNTPFFRG